MAAQHLSCPENAQHVFWSSARGKQFAIQRGACRLRVCAAGSRVELEVNQKFPSDVKISILDEKKFSKLAPSPGTVGLSINRSQHGLLSEIFVKNDLLGRVMLTLGHELGHVLTPTLANSVNEEAKAYAFSLLWMRVVKENDIANLGDAIVLENPARNGLHDVAFSFVMDCMNREEDLEEVYERLIKEKWLKCALRGTEFTRL